MGVERTFLAEGMTCVRSLRADGASVECRGSRKKTQESGVAVTKGWAGSACLGFEYQTEDFKFYWKGHWKPLEWFKQESDLFSFF